MLWWLLVFILINIFASRHARALVFRRHGIEADSRERLAFANKLIKRTPLGKHLSLSLRSKSYWNTGSDIQLVSRLKVAASGVLSSLLLAAVSLSVLALFNIPTVFNNQFQYTDDATVVQSRLRIFRVVEGSQAERVQIPVNGVPVTVGGEHIRDSTHFSELEQHFSGKTVELVYDDGYEQQGRALEIDADGESNIDLRNLEVLKYGISAPVVGVATTGQLVYFSVAELWGGATNYTEGVDMLKNADQLGYSYVAYSIAFVSVVYALANLLPFPPFAVGRALFPDWFSMLRKSLVSRSKLLRRRS